MKKFFTLIAIVITLASNAQESVLLRLNYKAGDQYLVTMNMEQGEMMSMGLEMNMEIKKRVDTLYNIEMDVKSIAMDMNQGGMEMSYDSKTPEEELDDMGKMIKTQFAPMLTATIFSTMTHRAETVETRVEPLVQGMDQFSNGAGNVVYPKEAVKLGESWTVDKIENGMEMKMKYTVKAISEKLVAIEITGEISQMAGGTISGSMEIERATGNVNVAKINMNMVASGQEMNIIIDMTTTKL